MSTNQNRLAGGRVRRPAVMLATVGILIGTTGGTCTSEQRDIVIRDAIAPATVDVFTALGSLFGRFVAASFVPIPDEEEPPAETP